MHRVIAVLTILIGLAAEGSVAYGQAANGANPPFPFLVLAREEVRSGKAPAHAANETAWSTAMTKGQSPVRWLAMTSMLGPSEAWFLTGHQSYAEWAKSEAGLDAMPALRAESDRFAGLEADILSRTSTMLLRYRPGLSYQAEVVLPKMRFMSVDVMQVKPGQIPQFLAAWRMQVDAHKKANMDEHWAVYEVVGGGTEGTFMFFYPMESLETLDRSATVHGDAFRTAVGENGRTQMRELDREAMESSRTLLFQLNPAMSVLTPEWAAADSFWAPRPAAPAAPAARRPGQQ